jgi:hypothetical protein
VIITNADPQKQGSFPASYSLIHRKDIIIDLGTYYTDPDDTLQLTATYSRNGKAIKTVPAEIFTFSSPFVIEVTSTGIADVGTYVFTVVVTDGLASLTDTFTLAITNEDPVLLKTFSNMTVR